MANLCNQDFYSKDDIMKKLIIIFSFTFLIFNYVYAQKYYNEITNIGDAMVGEEKPGVCEIKDLRTRQAKTFYNNDGTFAFMSGIGAVHYRENNEWE